MVESQVPRTIAPYGAEVIGSQVERQLIDALTAPDLSAVGAGLADFSESVPECKVRTLAVSEAALGDPRDRPAERRTHILPASRDSILHCGVD